MGTILDVASVIILLFSFVVFWIVYVKYKEFYCLVELEDLDNGVKIDHDPPVYRSRSYTSIKLPMPIIRESKNEYLSKIIRSHNRWVKLYWILVATLIVTVFIKQFFE